MTSRLSHRDARGVAAVLLIAAMMAATVASFQMLRFTGNPLEYAEARCQGEHRPGDANLDPECVTEHEVRPVLLSFPGITATSVALALASVVAGWSSFSRRRRWILVVVALLASSVAVGMVITAVLELRE